MRNGSSGCPGVRPSERLRQYLEWAGVSRAELFVTDRTRKQVTFYDLRATGITWMAIRGEEPLEIMQRAGHVEFKTTQGYIRAAEELAHTIGPGDVFPTLEEGVISARISAEGPAAWANLRGSQWKMRRPQGIYTSGFSGMPADLLAGEPLPRLVA